jgi:DNA-binding CsgD family transcriptional regulator
MLRPQGHWTRAQGGGRHTSGALIARDRELEVLLEALERARSGACAVVLEGEAGVGKTALWRRAVQEAREGGWRILLSTPTGSEARLAFAALGDLLDRDLDEVAPGLPTPQRIAIERALLRRARTGGRAHVDERTIGVAVLSALRALALRGPLVVAIDDLQWVDPASAAVLRFALRRLTDEPILVLATRRLEPVPRGGPELQRILGDERVARVHVPLLSVGAIHDLVMARLGFDPSRSILLRLHELTGGNAFFALEIARELMTRGVEPAPGDPLPVPGSVRELVQTRFARLSRRTRTVLLASAALARPTRSLLSGVDSQADAALTEAQAAGVIELSGGERIRFTHPLFASILYEQAPLAERRRTHARLSGLVGDLEERARHLALASSGADDAVAAELDAAVRAAQRRGAPQAAAELCDLAARLTSDAARRAARVLVSAEQHRQAGSLGLATDRAREALESAQEPEMRARALAVLGTVTTDSDGIEAGLPYYRRALRERGAPRSLRSDVHHKLAWIALVAADARCAERHAYAMTRLSDDGDPAAAAAAAATLSHAIVARGRPVPRELLTRALALESSSRNDRSWAWSETGPTVLEGAVLLWGGEIEEARIPLERVLEEATERGHLWLEMMALAYLSSVQTGLGRPRAGFELAERYLALATMVGQDAHRSGALWPLAVTAGWLGRTAQATEAAQEGLALAQRMGHGLYVIGNLTALGAVQLSLGEPSSAAGTLLRAWELADAGGIASPARFPMLADAVEALVLTGDVDRAATLAAEHERISQTLSRPWALALAERCRGLVAEAQGEDERAQAAFARAITEHTQQERPLDRARTLLACGAAHRRRRRKSAAREALEQAVGIFAAAGAEVWAQRARSELGRIGGRRATPAVGLSATEAAIAGRVATGQTNREIGEALHLSARTVEWNLSRVYRKLGVRSRTELAMAVGGNGRVDPTDPPALARSSRSKSSDFPG